MGGPVSEKFQLLSFFYRNGEGQKLSRPRRVAPYGIEAIALIHGTAEASDGQDYTRGPTADRSNGRPGI